MSIKPILESFDGRDVQNISYACGSFGMRRRQFREELSSLSRNLKSLL